jgi:hypothetical protein
MTGNAFGALPAVVIILYFLRESEYIACLKPSEQACSYYGALVSNITIIYHLGIDESCRHIEAKVTREDAIVTHRQNHRIGLETIGKLVSLDTTESIVRFDRVGDIDNARCWRCARDCVSGFSGFYVALN